MPATLDAFQPRPKTARRWMFGLGLLALLLVVQLETNAWLFPLVVVLAAVSVLVIPVGFLLSKPPRRAYWLIVASAMALQLPLFPLIHHWQESISQRRAATIIQALEAYRHDQQQLPDSLEQLTPRYLSRLPSTGFGTFTHAPFFYYSPGLTEDSTQYMLGYGVGLFGQATYDNHSRRWHYDD
ncbi:hypothetical protein LRS06_00740 [Hymenobacter sp. J193]|uniref:hypothetical protein n=1 Tax=Hymenobacter sp. J193 TaxID=2898429 RepID=UPI002151748C|nr:hypothetical protein [Hymenobacter sp. J193]MCR5886319.1 hypothetical protein [Hymenobacter sp. J193]